MSLLDDVSIVVTPNGYKAGDLYAVIPVPTEGAEEVLNGDFATSTDWTLIDGATISGGQANIDGDGTSFTSIRQTNVFTAGKRYKVTADVIITSGLGLKFQDGANNENIGFSTTTGSYEFYFTATSDTFLIIGRRTSGTAFASSVDNVSVKEWTAADMDVTRATAATRVDENGLVNYAEVIGGEEISCGDFECADPDAVWTRGTGWSISGGTANCIGGAGSLNLTQVALEIGKTYTVTYTVSNYSAGTIHPIMGGWTHGTYQSSNGTYTEVISNNHASANTTFYMQGKSGFVGSIDNVSVKEVTRDNVPRIDYTGGGCPHILAEPQRTNLWKNSEGSGITLTSPLGTFGFYDITSSATVSSESITAGTIVSATFIVKKADGTTPTITNSGGAGDVVFRITGTSDAGVDGALTDIGNGFYTYKLENYSVSGFNSDNRISNNSGDVVYVSLIQLEEGSYSTSYIPTSGSTVTRNQDQFTRDGISSLINSTEGVLFAEMAAFEDDDDYRYLGLNDGTDDNRVVILYYLNNNRIRAVLSSGGVNFVDEYYTVSSLSDFHKIALKWKANDFSLWVNGVERATETSVTVPVGLSHLSFDKGGGADTFNGKVKQLQVYKTALTDVQLAALTS